jgi:TetR/AcrR family transcriptional repressor of nem operon
MFSEASTTRDRIIESARVLFLEQGYGATGLAQILKKAEANSGSLYYFFPTKEDLLIAVLGRYKEMLWPFVIQSVFDRVSDPIERIFGILDGYRRRLLQSDCSYGCPIGNLALELANSHPAARAHLAENFTLWCDAIRKCLDEASGRLPEDTDSEQLSRFVLVTMEGGVMLARTHRNLEYFDSAVTQLRAYFDQLIERGTDWNKQTERTD